MFKQYRPVELPNGAYDVVVYREEDGAALRAAVCQVPDRGLAAEIADEMNSAYQAGEIAGSRAHLPKSIEELETRIMNGEIQADPPPFDIEELRNS